MARLMDFLGRGNKSGSQAALEALSRMDRERSTCWIEVESTPVRFASRLALRSGMVLLTCPKTLGSAIQKGRWVRIRLESPERTDLRLEISAANLAGSQEANQFHCKLPSAVLEEAKRKHARYYTGMFKDLLLEIATHGAPYPVLDLSHSGLRVRLPSEESRGHFVPGDYLEVPARIVLGSKAAVSLRDLVPRYVSETEVGLEMVVAEGQSRKILEIFLESLETRQKGKPT